MVYSLPRPWSSVRWPHPGPRSQGELQLISPWSAFVKCATILIFEMTSQLKPQLIHLFSLPFSSRLCKKPTPGPALRTVPFCDYNLKPQNHRVQRENTTCFPSAGQSKCEAAGWKLGRFHYCCRVAATEPAAVVFAGYEIMGVFPEKFDRNKRRFRRIKFLNFTKL